MQSLNRQYGKLRGKTNADDSKIINLINDYGDIDNALTKIIEDAKVLQNAWHSMSVYQTDMAKFYHELYDPVVGTCEGEGRPMAVTPPQLVNRTTNLYQTYTDLQEELKADIESIETLVLQPASDCKDMIQPFKALIKKRDNRRVDCDCAQDKVNKLLRKPKKTAKDESAVTKAQNDFTVLSEDFATADARLRDTLAPLVRACFSFLAPLLEQHVTIQNRLLGLCYTVLHEYCLDNDFPSPPPDMQTVITAWNAAFQPVSEQIEGFAIVRKHPTYNQRTGTTRPALRKAQSSRQLSAPRLQIAASPSPSPADSYPSPAPSPNPQMKRRPSGITVPTDFTTATIYQGSRKPASTADLRGDYMSQAAAKKKPPPPPPPKPRRQEMVVADYDFAGGVGDLSFSAGDMIRVIKRTATDQDWWEGELHNLRGNFPANYCRPVA